MGSCKVFKLLSDPPVWVHKFKWLRWSEQLPTLPRVIPDLFTINWRWRIISGCTDSTGMFAFSFFNTGITQPIVQAIAHWYVHLWSLWACKHSSEENIEILQIGEGMGKEQTLIYSSQTLSISTLKLKRCNRCSLSLADTETADDNEVWVVSQTLTQPRQRRPPYRYKNFTQTPSSFCVKPTFSLTA